MDEREGFGKGRECYCKVSVDVFVGVDSDVDCQVGGIFRDAKKREGLLPRPLYSAQQLIDWENVLREEKGM